MDAAQARVELAGVPETALWNLYQRASAASAGYLDDPHAVDVLARLDYPFERFDVPYGGLAARLHALRVRTVDAALRGVLAGAPDATVVALGEGFETQFWRVDDGRLRWLTLDLPEVVAVRREVLPDGPRNRILAGSATEEEWTAQVDRNGQWSSPPRACCRTSSGARCTACSPPGLACCPVHGCCSTR